MGRPPKYIINIGDIYDDYKCIDIIQETTGQKRKKYIMKCQKCGKVKSMLGSTVGLHKGTKHKSCGKGLGITYDEYFYKRWKSMRARTSPNFWNREITVENIETGEIEYCKNALQYTYDHPEIPHKYIYDLLKYNRTYKGKKFTKITKQDFEEYKKSLIIEQNLKV